ncbi:MAG: radical SAM protein [Desulfococcaceae bacterium]|jgi:anaerobic magnesium-protoporphyrin IX monomethyl ester cyclase|nr:radical SAM protein [Desulfococcaceae bacterium]
MKTYDVKNTPDTAKEKHGREQSPPADVLLIYPYFYTHAPKAMLFHPLGIARLAALLRGCGLVTQVIDCTFDHREAVISKIVHARPRIVGMYAMLSMSENAMALAGNIRDLLPETLLVCGGPLPTLKPDQFSARFDAVFCGEADVSFPRFCLDYIESGSSPGSLSLFVKDPEKYPGIYFDNPHEGTVVKSDPRPSDEKSLDCLPIPDRSDYAHSKYQQFWLDREEFSLAGIMTSYGCPFDCDFCSKPVFGNRLRRRSMDRIFEEIRDIKDKGYKGLWIADDCFSLDPEHTRCFCHRLISEKLDMKWFCLSRVDRISQSDIDIWQASGCRKVFFGLESGSNEVLTLMNKKTTTDVAEKTIERFAQSDIRTAGFFMVGYPGETYDTIEKTFQWALSLPLDEISFTIPFPLPGTRLYNRVMHVNRNLDWQYENENRMVFQSDFDEDYLKNRIDSVYKQFEAGHAKVKTMDVQAGKILTGK